MVRITRPDHFSVFSRLIHSKLRLKPKAGQTRLYAKSGGKTPIPEVFRLSKGHLAANV